MSKYSKWHTKRLVITWASLRRAYAAAITGHGKLSTKQAEKCGKVAQEIKAELIERGYQF